MCQAKRVLPMWPKYNKKCVVVIIKHWFKFVYDESWTGLKHKCLFSLEWRYHVGFKHKTDHDVFLSFRASCGAVSSDTRIIFLQRLRSWVDCQWAAQTLWDAAVRHCANARSLSAAWLNWLKEKHTSIRDWMKPSIPTENTPQTGVRDPDRSTVKAEVHGWDLRVTPLTPMTTDREPNRSTKRRCCWKKRRSCLGIYYSCPELLVNGLWFQEQAAETANGPCRVSTPHTVWTMSQTSNRARARARAREGRHPRDRTPLTTSRCFCSCGLFSCF